MPVLSQRVVTLLVDRLELAWTRGDLVLGLDQYGRLLGVLFPEAFSEPRRKTRVTRTLPGTPEKFRELCRRARRGESLFAPGKDNDWVADDRTGRAVSRDQAGNDVLGMIMTQRHDGLSELPNRTVHKNLDPGNFWWEVRLPDGRGCHVQANTKSEARSQARKILTPGQRGHLVGAVITKIDPPGQTVASATE